MAKKRRNKTTKGKMLHTIQPNAAGIDIGATAIYVAVTHDRDSHPVRRFETFTEDLHKAAKWLHPKAIATSLSTRPRTDERV